MDSRLKTWRELSAAWEIPPWPLTVTLVHSLGASFKRGRYQSCSLYFGAAIAHQLRTLGLPVGEEIRFAVKDTVRAIKRGLGPSQLKDSFDFEALKALVNPAAELRAFDPEDLGAMLDMTIIGAWWRMLREIEISNARLRRLYLEGSDLVHLLVPISKADTRGSLTVRSYLCVCRARVEFLCPYHATKRRLARMHILVETKGECEFLFPDRELQPLKKVDVIRMIEHVLGQASVPITRPDESGRQTPRFGGHCLRVSGTQWLASLNIPLPQIQLQGRWSSRAIDRHVQLAPLLRLPQAVRAATAGGKTALAIADDNHQPRARQKRGRREAVDLEAEPERLAIEASEPEAAAPAPDMSGSDSRAQDADCASAQAGGPCHTCCGAQSAAGAMAGPDSTA